MAITISGDHYHSQAKVSAEPFDAEEAERLIELKQFVKQAERDAEQRWRATPKPLSEKETLSFAFDESLAPKKFRLTSGNHHWDYCDHIGLGGANAVNQRFKDVIESIEPGVHQFIPFDLYDRDGKLIDKPLYFWRIRTTLDAIDPSLGGVEPLEIPGVTPPGGGKDHLWQVKTGGGHEKLAVRKDLTAGRAAWRDIRLVSRRFVSDAVVSLLEAQKLDGWTATHHWKEV